MPRPRKPQRGSSYRSFAIVYEDEHLLVVSKPAGLLTNMAEDGEQTLQDQLRKHFKQPEIAAVHRLDRYTSGLVVFGRTPGALSALGEMLRDGGFEKRYWVLTAGVPNPRRGTIDVPLAKIEHPRRKVAVSNAPEAQSAVTDYQVEEELPGFALVAATIRTGRTHQLRAHFEHLGFPIAGDNIYGNKKANGELRHHFGLQRQFIHARELAFRHPVTGAELKLQAKLPKDLSGVLKSLRQSGLQQT
ncbi:MAG: RluA family pseudouridine synthase [Planctomycetes bacterium]|nr:RluA family pseudouridine synthase [Planctomycetota bacterium]